MLDSVAVKHPFEECKEVLKNSVYFVFYCEFKWASPVLNYFA